MRRCAISADGRTLATGGEDKTLKLWVLSTGDNLGTLEGHAGAICSVSFLPDGALLSTVLGEPEEGSIEVRIWMKD